MPPLPPLNAALTWTYSAAVVKGRGHITLEDLVNFLWCTITIMYVHRSRVMP